MYISSATAGDDNVNQKVVDVAAMAMLLLVATRVPVETTMVTLQI